MNLFLGKSSEKHLKCEKYDKRKARAFAWDFVYSLRAGVLKKEHQLFLPVPGMVCVYRVVLDSAASSATMMALGWNCRMLAGT